MEAAFAGEALDRDDFPPGNQAERSQTTVKGAVSGLSISIPANQGHRTSAAVAFRAAFLGPGQPGVAQILEQGGVGRAVLDPDGPAIQDKFNGAGHSSTRSYLGSGRRQWKSGGNRQDKPPRTGQRQIGDQAPRGSGTESRRQIFRERYLPISACRGTASTSPVAGFSHRECFVPSRSNRQPWA